MTEKEKYNKRLQEKIDNGLKAVGFALAPDASLGVIDEEKLYGELNRMYDAKDLPDPEILGEYGE